MYGGGCLGFYISYLEMKRALNASANYVIFDPQRRGPGPSSVGWVEKLREDLKGEEEDCRAEQSVVQRAVLCELCAGSGACREGAAQTSSRRSLGGARALPGTLIQPQGTTLERCE